MKKKILLIFVALFMVFACISCSESKDYKADDYIIKYDMGEKSELKVLQLTDIHMGQMDDADSHKTFINKVVTNANPDFIVVTGDVFTFATKDVAMDLFKFFDETLKTPWTLTWGNHDEQCYFSIDWVTSYLNGLNDKRVKDGSSYCYFKDLQDDNVKGNANFVIQAVRGNDVFENLIIMDSNRYYFGEYMYYDYMDETQIAWYDMMMEKIGGSKSLMFFHIPLPEFSNYDLDENGYNKDGVKVEFEAGEYGEDACSPDKNLGFFNDHIKGSNVEGIFVGHDHVNDYVVNHEGVYFTYGVKATNRVYYEEGMLGGTLIVCKNAKLDSITQITYASYEAKTPTTKTVTMGAK